MDTNDRSADAQTAMLQGLAQGMVNQGVGLYRTWNVGVIAANTREGVQSSLGGLANDGAVAQQLGIGFDGTNTFAPFTSDLSVVGGPDLVSG